LVAGLDGDASLPKLCGLTGDHFLSADVSDWVWCSLGAAILRRIIPDEAAVETITQEQAVAAVKECMKVLFYRDARSLDKYSIATITRGWSRLKGG
jgi:20S proteasome subunit beta 7